MRDGNHHCPNGETADEDLRQADLSHLQLSEMNAAQRRRDPSPLRRFHQAPGQAPPAAKPVAVEAAGNQRLDPREEGAAVASLSSSLEPSPSGRGQGEGRRASRLSPNQAAHALTPGPLPEGEGGGKHRVPAAPYRMNFDRSAFFASTPTCSRDHRRPSMLTTVPAVWSEGGVKADLLEQALEHRVQPPAPPIFSTDELICSARPGDLVDRLVGEVEDHLLGLHQRLVLLDQAGPRAR